MIQFEHVCKSYGKTPILKDLNFTIQDGQFVVLIGPSGCGKTTTLKTINRLIDIDSGTISIDGKDIQGQDKVELRRHIGYVIQQIGLFPNMTVAQNICVVPKLLKYDKAKCDEIVQMASPEEMLEHPANDLVRNFLGKHATDAPAPSTVEHFMRTNLVTVKKDRGVMECAERMARSSVDSLLVTDEEGRYAGTISIGDIRRWGRELSSIEPMVRQTARTVRVGDDARESFDYLLDSGAGYVVVLNEDDTIAGIVTKTSVARSVAENLWGDAK